MAVEMRLPVARKPLSESLGRDTKKHLVVPGDTITTDTGFMRYEGARGRGARLQGPARGQLAGVRWRPGPRTPVLSVASLTEVSLRAAGACLRRSRLLSARDSGGEGLHPDLGVTGAQPWLAVRLGRTRGTSGPRWAGLVRR